MSTRAYLGALFALALAFLASACGGAGGAGPGGEAATGGPNTFKASWGHYRAPTGTWYISDSVVGWNDMKYYYRISSASATEIRATYDETLSAGAYSPPPADKKSVTLTRTSPSAFSCTAVTGSSQIGWSNYPFLIAQVLGTEAQASGTAMQGSFARGLSRALQPVGVSLVLTNVLNAQDTHTVASNPVTGAFSASDLIPGDSYSIAQSTGGPASIVTIGEDRADLGLVVKPQGSYVLKCEGRVTGSDGLNNYFYAGAAGDITARVGISGSGSTGWAQWQFWKDGVALPKSSYPGVAQWDYFELPHESGDLFNTMGTKLPADLVPASSIPAGEDAVDIVLKLTGSPTGTGTTPFWEDQMTLRYYRESFALSNFVTATGMKIAVALTLITPELRSHSLETTAYGEQAEVPRMKGRYYVIAQGSGDYYLGLGVAKTSISAPTPDETEAAATSNDSRSTATSLVFGRIFKGSVGPQTWDYTNPDPVDYLYFDIP